MPLNNRQRQAKLLRDFRKIHRLTGASLFIFFAIIGISGLLLGWKKNSGGYLLAKSSKGTSTDLRQWLPLDSLHHIAVHTMSDLQQPTVIDRIDVRPDKGIVKFTFKDHYTGLQIDGATGEVLLIEQRRADWIEDLHDGSLIDNYLGISGEWFKLLYTSIMGLALLVFTVTGFWLWYGPKQMRQ
ncbi:PepSY domain-containing protein [Rhodoflexus sp.]